MQSRQLNEIMNDIKIVSANISEILNSLKPLNDAASLNQEDIRILTATQEKINNTERQLTQIVNEVMGLAESAKFEKHLGTLQTNLDVLKQQNTELLKRHDTTFASAKDKEEDSADIDTPEQQAFAAAKKHIQENRDVFSAFAFADEDDGPDAIKDAISEEQFNKLSDAMKKELHNFARAKYAELNPPMESVDLSSSEEDIADIRTRVRNILYVMPNSMALHKEIKDAEFELNNDNDIENLDELFDDLHDAKSVNDVKEALDKIIEYNNDTELDTAARAIFEEIRDLQEIIEQVTNPHDETEDLYFRQTDTDVSDESPPPPPPRNDEDSGVSDSTEAGPPPPLPDDDDSFTSSSEGEDDSWDSDTEEDNRPAALAAAKLNSLITDVQPGGATPNAALHTFLNDDANKLTIKNALTHLYGEDPEHPNLVETTINSQFNKAINATTAADMPVALFNANLDDTTKTNIAAANNTRLATPDRTWANAAYAKLLARVAPDSEDQNETVHRLLTENKDDVIANLIDIHHDDHAYADAYTSSIIDSVIAAKADTEVSKKFFGINLTDFSRQEIADKNNTRLAGRVPPPPPPPHDESDAVRKSIKPEQFKQIVRNLHVDKAAKFDRYERYALAVSALENINPHTNRPMPEAEAQGYLDKLTSISNSLTDFKKLLQQMQADKKLGKAEINKLDADYKKLLNSISSTDINNLLVRTDKDLATIDDAYNKVNSVKGVRSDERSFGTTYTVDNSLIYPAPGSSKNNYNDAKRAADAALDSPGTKPDPLNGIASGKELKELQTASKDDEVIAFKVCVRDKKHIQLDTASIRTFNPGKQSARIQFIIPAESEKRLTSIFKGAYMRVGGSTLPSMPVMEWAAQNIQSLRSVMELKNQPIRILSGTKPHMIDALVIYCKHKGYAYETPHNYKDKISSQQVANFGQKWKESHSEDIGKRTSVRLESDVLHTPRPGKS